MTETKKLTNKELTSSWLRWVCFGQQCYNFEIMQGLGFTESMIPIINALYPEDKEKKKEALERHLTYYNTENNWGAAIAGIVASMEEEKANGAEISDSAISSLKAALMGPLAGITVYTLGFSHYVYFMGYKQGKSSVTKLLANGKLAAVTDAMGVLGMMVLGNLIATSISLKTPLVIALGETSVVLQDVLNAILPCILPLAAVLACYKMVNKGMKPINIILVLFVIGIVGGLLGILA